MNHEWFSDVNWDSIRNKTHRTPYVPELDCETDTKYFSQEFTQMVIGMGNLELESQDSDISTIEDSSINWLYPRTEKETECMQDMDI